MATWYASVAWTNAVLNVELGETVADCQEALKLEPTNGPLFNSLGLILVRMGRFPEAIAAYDEALKHPLSDDTDLLRGLYDERGHYALFGRGFAKLKTGDVEGGKTDIAAAEKLRRGVTAEFALYGIVPP